MTRTTMTPRTLSRSLLLVLALLPICVTAARAGDQDVRGALAKDDAIAKKKADLVFRARMGRAIATGARWIAGQQQKDGSFKLEGNRQDGPFPQSRHGFGVSALCTYTLADCGYNIEHPVIKKALRYLRKHYPRYLKGDHWPQASAYSLALMVLGLHTLYVKPGQEAHVAKRDRYGARKHDKKNPCGYPAWARKAIHRILDWFMDNQAATGLFRYPGGFNVGTRAPPGGPGGRAASHYGDEDLSNTQYVLLALWAGSRCGYDIAPEQLEKIAKRLLVYQKKLGEGVMRVEDPAPAPAKPGKKGTRYAKPTRGGGETTARKDRARGFPYTLGGEASGSMTTAGLSSLLIVKAMLLERGKVPEDLRAKLDKGIWDAIAWLQVNYTVHRNPPQGIMWHYYYLYGLERACVIAGKRFLGEHDWYREGAEMLLDAQREGGRWEPDGQLGRFGGAMRGGPSPYHTTMLDTCFALLFLKRATLVPLVPVLETPKPVTTGGG